MKIQGRDFCIEEHFRGAYTKSVSLDLLSPEMLKSLEGKTITAVRLKNIVDRECAADATVAYLEIEAE